MKKIDLIDLQLSPKVVTDLTGSVGGKGYTDECTGTQTCNQSVADVCYTQNDQCLSENDNPCASDDQCSGTCLCTQNDTCNCTELCGGTRSDDVQCCEATNDVNTECCIQHISIQICPETDDCMSLQCGTLVTCNHIPSTRNNC